MKIGIVALQDLLYQLDTSPVGDNYVANWLKLRNLFN